MKMAIRVGRATRPGRHSRSSICTHSGGGSIEGGGGASGGGEIFFFGSGLKQKSNHYLQNLIVFLSFFNVFSSDNNTFSLIASTTWLLSTRCHSV
jgi:hypothetical protein